MSDSLSNTSLTEPSFHVVFRACDKVIAVNGSPRPFHLTKRAVIELCLLTLLKSLRSVRYRVTILADSTSDELNRFFESLSPFPITIHYGTWGNEGSLHHQFNHALESERSEWVYLCEDDYVHREQTFFHITDLIVNREKILFHRPRGFFPRHFAPRFHEMPLVIHPPDYPDRYLPFRRKKSYLFLGNTSHWRQISSTTFTLMCRADVLQRFEPQFRRSFKNADDGLLSRSLYGQWYYRGKALCLSPLPGLTAHFHHDALTPLISWENEINIAKALREMINNKIFDSLKPLVSIRSGEE